MSPRGPCRPPTGACRPRGTPWTSRNTSRRRCLPGGKAPRCSPHPAAPPAQCGSSLRPSTAGGSDAECPSALVLPALCPARISVSSSLLAATMNQKSSLRKVPQFVSGVLTGNNGDFTVAGTGLAVTGGYSSRFVAEEAANVYYGNWGLHFDTSHDWREENADYVV